MPYHNWKDPENESRLIFAVAESKSIAKVCRALGLKAVGGNYASLKHHIARLELDTTHHTGKGWNKENYKDRNYSTNTFAKKSLIRNRGHKCEKCYLSEWLDQPIKLELEHINGINSDYLESNLKLLCPNCHSQTKTWRRRKSSL